MKKVTGIGGIFFKCKDPQKVKDWYSKNLGLQADEYGTTFEWRKESDSSAKGFTQWSPFPENTEYFNPSTKDFMINYRVENLQELVDQLKRDNVTIYHYGYEKSEYGIEWMRYEADCQTIRLSKRMNYILQIIWIIWLLSEILLNRLLRSKSTNSKELDKNSMNLIWIAILVSMTSGILIAIYWVAPIINTNVLLYFGSILIVIGMSIRFIAIRTLGKFFTVNLAINDDHRLIKSGMYKYIRHPSYSGSLLSFAGFGLSLNNWLSLIIILVPILITFINRINIEEKLLHEQFGSEYEEYKKSTKRMIPMIY